MAKRKKHPNLPNGFGTIRFLGKNRRRPYAAHPPAAPREEDGIYVRPKALCYCSTWYVAFAVLNAWRAGTYHPGDEAEYEQLLAGQDAGPDLDGAIARLLADGGIRRRGMTFEDVYLEWHEWKFGENAAKDLSVSARRIADMCHSLAEGIHGRPAKDITPNDLQALINGAGKSQGTLAHFKTFLGQVFRYALDRGYVDKDPTGNLVIPGKAAAAKEGNPFTADEVRMIWADRDDDTSGMLCILIYSGFRIGEVKGLAVDMEAWSFTGGSKTRAGKGRVVPVHPCIRGLVKARMERDGKLATVTDDAFRKRMAARLAALGIETGQEEDRHTPHDCRHTFSALCERYEVREADRKRMLGHSLSKDVTNGVYGHRTLEDLAEQIVKIPAPDGLR